MDLLHLAILSIPAGVLGYIGHKAYRMYNYKSPPRVKDRYVHEVRKHVYPGYLVVSYGKLDSSGNKVPDFTFSVALPVVEGTPKREFLERHKPGQVIKNLPGEWNEYLLSRPEAYTF